MTNESKQENMTYFNGKDEAFEFLVQQSQHHILKEHWQKEMDLLSEKRENNGFHNTHRLFIQIIGILAVLIALMGLFYRFHSDRNSLDSMTNRMIEDSYFAVANDFDVRGVKDVASDRILKDLQHEINLSLELGDYNAAIGLFKTKEKQTQLSSEDKFYYSIALSKIDKGDYHKAIRMLDSVLEENDNYQNESLWLQGLLYIKVGDKGSSKIVFLELLEKSDYKSNNVRLLLHKMTDS